MDLQMIDGLAWVRERPRQFFRNERVDAMSLLAYVMADVLELGKGECHIWNDESWWFVASNVDWLQDPRFSVLELFARVIPAPDHGEHSMRAEVLLNAFAADVFVWERDQALLIKGGPPDQQRLDAAVSSSWCRRLVAFRVAGRPSPQQ